MIAVFDTNIVIDALNGVADADVEYSRYARVLISRITWIEVMVGVREDEAQVRNLLETRFEMIPLDFAVAEKAVDLRRSYRLRLPDAIIWATAQVHATVLVTRNTRDFDVTWNGIRVPYQLPPG
ncbi:MAG: type II toxin-antitoxin system VapC family toxin [Caldilinea sp.]